MSEIALQVRFDCGDERVIVALARNPPCNQLAAQRSRRRKSPAMKALTLNHLPFVFGGKQMCEALAVNLR